MQRADGKGCARGEKDVYGRGSDEQFCIVATNSNPMTLFKCAKPEIARNNAAIDALMEFLQPEVFVQRPLSAMYDFSIFVDSIQLLTCIWQRLGCDCVDRVGSS